MSEQQIVLQHSKGWRLWLVCTLLVAIAIAIVFKLVTLYTYDKDFLQSQGDKRTIRTMQIPAHRGVITDRNGEALAVSAPVAAVWVNPKVVDLANPKLKQLSRLLGKKSNAIADKIKGNANRSFVYLKRQISPDLAA